MDQLETPYNTLNDFLLTLPFNRRQTVLDTLLKYPELVPVLIENLRMKERLGSNDPNITFDDVRAFEKKHLARLLKLYE